jgi:voltage-gated potassium channel
MRDDQTLKAYVHQIMEADEGDTLADKIFDSFIMVLIFLNVTAVILSTVKSLADKYSLIFYYFEVFSVIVFSLEYILRLWSITEDEEYSRPFIGRIRFMLTPMAIIDLVAILPIFLLFFAQQFAIPIDLRFIRAVRFVRIFRLFKMTRYSSSLKHLVSVLKKKKQELVITVFCVVLLLVMSSSMMYFVEHPTQPDQFSSIPASMWWGVVTLTTVGYGDMYPRTPLGQLLAAVIAFLGIGMFALPAGILASGFSEEMQKESCPTKCPHCGEKLE